MIILIFFTLFQFQVASREEANGTRRIRTHPPRPARSFRRRVRRRSTASGAWWIRTRTGSKTRRFPFESCMLYIGERASKVAIKAEYFFFRCCKRVCVRAEMEGEDVLNPSFEVTHTEEQMNHFYFHYKQPIISRCFLKESKANSCNFSLFSSYNSMKKYHLFCT